MTEAILLVGGYGTRLKPLTIHTPKPMLKVAGFPVTQHQISKAKNAGIDHIVLGTAFKAEVFKTYLGDGSFMGVKLDYAYEPVQLGTGGGIRNASQFLTCGPEDPVVIFNGDVLTGVNIENVLKIWKEKKADVALYLTKVKNPKAYGLVPTDKEGNVLAFLEKPEKDEDIVTDQINAGMYIFKRKIIDTIATEKVVSVEREVFPNLLKNNYKVYGLDLQPPQCSVENQLTVDIRELKSVPYQDIDAVVHLAALVKVNESVVQPCNYYNTNLNGTTNLLHSLSRNCKNFIFASTGSAEYCNNPYGISKRAAEDCVTELCKQKNLPFTIFRFYNVIGTNGYPPTNPDGLFYNLIKATTTGKFFLYGNNYNTHDGTAIRDYVHVDEICAAIEKSIEKPACQIENLGHGQGRSVLEIVDLFKQVNKVEFDVEYGPRRSGDLERSVLNNPSHYLPNLYSINELVKIPTNML